MSHPTDPTFPYNPHQDSPHKSPQEPATSKYGSPSPMKSSKSRVGAPKEPFEEPVVLDSYLYSSFSLTTFPMLIFTIFFKILHFNTDRVSTMNIQDLKPDPKKSSKAQYAMMTVGIVILSPFIIFFGVIILVFILLIALVMLMLALAMVCLIALKELPGVLTMILQLMGLFFLYDHLKDVESVIDADAILIIMKILLLLVYGVLCYKEIDGTTTNMLCVFNFYQGLPDTTQVKKYILIVLANGQLAVQYLSILLLSFMSTDFILQTNSFYKVILYFACLFMVLKMDNIVIELLELSKVYEGLMILFKWLVNIDPFDHELEKKRVLQRHEQRKLEESHHQSQHHSKVVDDNWDYEAELKIEQENTIRNRKCGPCAYETQQFVSVTIDYLEKLYKDGDTVSFKGKLLWIIFRWLSRGIILLFTLKFIYFLVLDFA